MTGGFWGCLQAGLCEGCFDLKNPLNPKPYTLNPLKMPIGFATGTWSSGGGVHKNAASDSFCCLPKATKTPKVSKFGSSPKRGP